MIAKDIDNLDLKELKAVLKQVKVFKDLKNKLWKRWIALFNRNKENKDLFIVEYFWENIVWEVYELSVKIFKEKFNNDLQKSDINFIRNDDIKWWIKIYKNDEMVDLSFLKIEKQIR